MDLEEPDRVPIYELAINAPVAKAVLGRMPKVDAYLLVDAKDYYNVYVGFGLDAMTMWDVGLPVEHVDAETFLDDWGRLWRKSQRSQVTYYVKGTIRSREDLEGFFPPGPYDNRRLEPVRRLTKMNKASLAIIGGIHDAFEIPSMMRGADDFLLDCYGNPRFAERLIEMSVEYNVELAKATIDSGVDALITGDDYAYKKVR